MINLYKLNQKFLISSQLQLYYHPIEYPYNLEPFEKFLDLQFISVYMMVASMNAQSTMS